MERDEATAREARTGLGLLLALEIGVAAILVLAPLPEGSVREPARTALEIASLALGLSWIVLAARRSVVLPPRTALAGALGLLLLAAAQALPLGAGVVGALSPRALEVRTEPRPPAGAAASEARLLGRDPATLDPLPTLSVDAGATASALRTGAALAALLLVAAAVAAERGPRGVALALLATAAIQGLHGTLDAAGSGRLASGTFVNKNHFAGLLAMALPAGIGLAISVWKGGPGERAGLARFVGGEGARALLLGLLALVGLSGLLLSLSRAGIAVGAVGIVATFAASGRRRLGARLAAAAIVLAIAAVPLAQIGAERLAEGYARVPEEITGAGSRGTVWGDTLSMVAAFPAVGTGFGTFASAYPLFRSPDVRHLFLHAHCDPLQVLSEGGVVGLALLLLLAAPVLRRTVWGLGGAGGPVAAGMAAGILAAVLHSLVDFNFHVPSNAATAAVLAGTMLGLPWRARS